jgi:hypothetical protein
MTTASLPDALSEAARGFASGPHEHVIGGERVASSDGRTFETVDPSTGLVIAEVAQGGADDVDSAVASGARCSRPSGPR